MNKRRGLEILHHMILVALLTMQLQPACAGNLSFLKGSAAENLDSTDVRLLMEAATAVVSDPDTPATRHWKNEMTGNYGELQTLSAFDGPKGIRCKRVRVVNHAGTRSSKSTYTMCDMPPDGWRLVPSNFAPQRKPKS